MVCQPRQNSLPIIAGTGSGNPCSWCKGILFVCFALLAGCALGPNYHRPPVETPPEFRNSSDPSSTNSLADLAWWQVFNDPTLTNLITIALTNNYDVRIAATRVEQARALAVQTKSQFFPQAGYEVEGFRGRNAISGSANPNGGGVTANSFVAALNASWEIDLWGRIRRLNEAARAQFLASEEARRGVRLSLIADVAQGYFQLLELDTELEIARRTSNSFAESLKIFNQRLGGGIGSKLETDRAEGALAAVSAVVPDLQQQIRLQENQLKVLLGLGSGSIDRTARLDDEVVPPQVPAGLPSSLLERRPDILEAEQLLHSASAQVGVAVGDFFPRIGLTALFGAASPELSALTGPEARLWSIGAQASGPLFQSGRLYGQYRQSRAAWDEAKLEYEQTILKALHEVSGQLYTRLKYEEANLQQIRSVAAYQDAVKVAGQRFRSGHAVYFEVLDAQKELYPQENALARTQFNRLLIIVRLYKSLGGGWNQQEANAAAR